ncbi:MAG: hypothetical protein H0T73_17935 [Ardenticatenales bacterium]|nr:hypothetical protein [Ardenticatenales bacterium]
MAFRRDDATGLLHPYEAKNLESLSQQLFVHLEEDTLILHAPRNRYGLLIPLTETRFHLQATPVDVEFVVEEGLANGLVLFRSNGEENIYRRLGAP